MTPEEVKAFIAKYPGAQNYVPDRHLEPVPALFEVEIREVKARKMDFKTQEGNLLPSKELIDAFGRAAGVMFDTSQEGTRKEGKYLFVGSSRAYVMGIDGNNVYGDRCEADFDAELKAEEDYLRDPNKFPTEASKQQRIIKYALNGRALANTRARKRAILSVLAMSTGLKDRNTGLNLFSDKDPPTKEVVFLFSCIVVNAKNKLVLNAMLANLSGSRASLFGPSSGNTLALQERPEDVLQTEDFDILGDDLPGNPEPEDDRQIYWDQLQDWSNKFGPALASSPNAKQAIDFELLNRKGSLDDLRVLASQVHDLLVRKGVLKEGV